MYSTNGERRRALWPTRELKLGRFQIDPPPTQAEVSLETRRAFLSGEARVWVSNRRLSLAERGLLELPEPARAAVLRALRILSEGRRAAAARAEAARS